MSEGYNSGDEVLSFEDVVGSRLVFVSSLDPKYVVTGDDRRLQVGDSIDEDTMLAGIINEHVVFEKSGELLVISLPGTE